MGAKSGRNKRGAKKPQAPKGGRQGGGANRSQRVGLVLFAVVFIALFVVFAVAQGLGAPSVPSGDIALVTSVPSELGHISEADYKHSYEQQVAQAGLKKAPKAGSKKAEELHEAAIGELVDTAWIIGEGEELGIKVTPKEVESELAKIKKESFPTEKKWQAFLKEENYTEEDVNERIELTVLSTKIEEKIKKETPTVTEAELKAYYEAERASQFTKKASRDVRVVVNENKKEVEAAQKALEADNSEASWKKVTKKYSPTTESNAGLQKEISEEYLTEPLKKDIFTAETGELIGPIKQESNYLLLEVVKLHAQTVESFEKVKSTISSTLTSQNEEKYFNNWLLGFQSKWRSRTYCAGDFMVESYCGNYKGNGHPAEASEACYEAEPKAPPKECPAPVIQNKPALPGSVTVTKPEGEALVQRPQPEESEKEKEKAEAEATEAEAEATESGEGEASGSETSTKAAEKAAEEAAAKAAEEAEASGE
ncbi:MAG: SurA N-terminal domain-containing protein [Solirubrobacterales bacterium]